LQLTDEVLVNKEHVVIQPVSLVSLAAGNFQICHLDCEEVF